MTNIYKAPNPTLNNERQESFKLKDLFSTANIALACSLFMSSILYLSLIGTRLSYLSINLFFDEIAVTIIFILAFAFFKFTKLIKKVYLSRLFHLFLAIGNIITAANIILHTVKSYRAQNNLTLDEILGSISRNEFEIYLEILHPFGRFIIFLSLCVFIIKLIRLFLDIQKNS